MGKQAILIHSKNIIRDIYILKQYASVKEYELYKEVRGAYHDGQWHLLIVGKNLNWTSICRKHKINHPGKENVFSINQIKPFFIKVIKCSKYCLENKELVGKTMQVIIDPVNSAFYKIYPPLPIQIVCNNDGNYSRKGYIYGVAVEDCIRTSFKIEKIVSDEWKRFKKSLPAKVPAHITLKAIHSINKIINK